MKRTLARFSKVLLLLGMWVAAVGAISIARADCTPSPSGLVSWWRAEGNATDAAGGNNGVLLNDATFGTGEAGQGFSFDGINDLVKIPKAANLDVGNQVTIEFWMKASPGNAMNTYQGLVTSDFFGIEIANGYVLGPLGVEFFISTDGGASVSPSSYPDTATVNGGGAQVSAGVWHHVAGTYDGTKLQLYIDGQPWGVPNYHTGAISPMLANSFVAIGAEDGRTICPDCVGSRYFNGQIDEPAIYNRALSQSEIQSIYNAGSAGKCGAALPVAPVIQTQPASQTVTAGNSIMFSALADGTAPLSYQWQWNGMNIFGATNTSLTLFNVQLNQAGNYSVLVSNAVNYAASSNALLTVNPAACVLPPAGLVSWWRAESNVLDNVTGNHGMLQNGAGFADGKVGSAFAFDGVDDYVLVNPTASLNVGLSSGFTVEAWINPTTTEVQMPIIEYENALGTFNGSDVGVHFYISVPGEGTGPGGFYANLQDTAGNGHFITSPAGLVAAGVWQHVALTYDQTSGNATVYLNGVMVAQASLGSFTPQTSFPNLLIGARTTFGSAANPSDKFSGRLDDLSIYDRALAPTEIAAIYNASSAGKCDAPVAPTIVQQPQDTVVLAGTPATFNVAAAGSAPLAYQWFANAAALSGETNSTLTLNNIVYPMTGNLYSVTITNAGGSVHSRDAVLTVINTPPQISNPGSQIVDYIAPPLGLPFTVSDAESSADNLQIYVDSSNTNLVPNAQIVVSGTGTNRIVTPTAITNLVGSTTITLTVVDEGGLSNQVSFGFTVINQSPRISGITAQRAPLNATIGPLAFTVSDAETPADQLVVAAFSSNNSIMPTNQIVLGGSGTNRTITILPGTNSLGSANVMITVIDGLGDTTSVNLFISWDQFTDVLAGLPALQYSAVAWGDYDNDGKLDLLVAGTTNGLPSGAVTRIYHNDNGAFTNFISLPGLFKCALAWNDYDRDGRLDIAISGLNSTNQAFSRIYHNNGNGTFTDIAAGLTGCYAGSVAWGDFNSDGAPDLFLCGLVTTTNGTTAVSTNILRLYRNDGDGVFTDMNLDLRTTFDNRLAAPNNGTAAWGDYDNDGRPDLLLVGPLNGITSVGYIYRNLGNGNFTNITVNSFGGLISSAAAWGDYDNDGWLDFAVFNSSGATSAVYHNNRNNTFTVAASFAGASGPQIAWGDYNNDGYLDLLVGNGRSIAKLYRNNGNGTFTDTLTTALSSTFDGALAWGDFDNDGDLDAVFCGSSNSALLRNNSGTTNSPPATPFDLFSTPGLTNSVVLTWQPPVDSQTKSNGLNYNLRVGTTPGGIDIVSPLADPTNGQRRVAAIGNVGPTNRAVLINLPKGTYYWSVQAIDTAFAGSPFFQLPGGVDQTFTITNERPAISDLADLTIAPGTNSPGPAIPFVIGDLETDTSNLVLSARSSNTNVVALTNIVFGGFGSNRTVQVTARTNGISVITVTVTDANGAFASDNFTVTAEQFSLQSSNFIQVQNSLVAWGDYNNDGRLDVLLAGNTNGTLTFPVTRLYRNDGNGIFTPVVSGLPNVTLGSAAWADFDNDGWLDLILTGTTNGNFTGTFSRVYRNNGDGTFTDINAGLPQLMNSAVAWGDYDNDGRPDLLLSGITNGSLSGAITRIYRNNGNGTFSNAISLAGIYLGSVAWADFDGDGDLDVVIAGQSTSGVGTALVYRNNGNGTFTQAATLTGVYNCSLAVADFNNDGLPDILLTGYNGSYLSLLYRNAGNFSFIQTQTTLPGARYASVAAGDYDNDGKPDILISGTTTGLATSGMARVYRNTTTLATAIQFSLIPTTLPTNYLGAVTWADFNNDGRLDVMITGVPFTLLASGRPSQTALYRNNNYVTNTPPTAPTALSYVRSNNLVSLAWAKATDAQTTNANGLKYQIRVGTNSGGLDIESPLADLSNGFRRVVRTGDASTNRWQLQNLPPGNYFWSVQAIDTAFAGSPFSAESTFTVLPPPIANPDAFTIPTNTLVTFNTAKLLLNDVDPSGLALRVLAVSSSSRTTLTFGTVVSHVVAGQILVDYTPPTDFSGNDTFTYTITDDQSAPATGTVTVTVGNGGLISLNIVSGPLVDGSDFVVCFAGIPGLTYTIEAASDLAGPWAKVANLTAPTYDQGFGVGIFEFREPMNGNTTRFYRTVYPSY